MKDNVDLKLVVDRFLLYKKKTIDQYLLEIEKKKKTINIVRRIRGII